MNIKQLETMMLRDLSNNNLPTYDPTKGYVDYETARLLFNWGFNEPCDTYFHNVDEFENEPEGTPEHDTWEGREDNWEMCNTGKFINYPDNFIVRYRYARPSYIQVLEWFEKKYDAKINVGPTMIFVKNLCIPRGQDYIIESFEYHVSSSISTPFELALETMSQIINRFKLFTESGSADAK